MKKLNYSWKIATYTIPNGAEVVCENAVSEKNITLGGALVRFKETGVYALVNAGIVRMCNQQDAHKIAEK